MPKADKPRTSGNREYHLHTSLGDLSPLCLIVGAPGRAVMIGEKYLQNVTWFKNEHRGLVSCTGFFEGVRVSVVTGGMGGASTGIVLPEAYRSGSRVFIRVGSCGSLVRKPKLGDAVIVTGAIRYDGVSSDWAPPEFPAMADWRVVAALYQAANELAPKRFITGMECTTSDFLNGQGRPDTYDEVAPNMLARHQEVMRLGAACYSMEAATLFVWCATQGKGIPAGAINAVFANRITNTWGTEGEELVSKIALKALLLLNQEPQMKHYTFRRLPKGKKK